ncbi:MAG: hypothetical protein ACRECA_09685, partial [Pseudolabrys sp.]
MKSERTEKPSDVADKRRASRNPFGVMDVPNPNDQETIEFAAAATLAGSADDDNAISWGTTGDRDHHDTIEGHWSTRWNGGADPAIPGDAKDKWKQGAAEVRIDGQRVYLRFDWHQGARQGPIDARRDGPERIAGKYINLTNPTII